MTQNCLPRVLALEHWCPLALHTPTTSRHTSKTFTLATSCDLVYLQVA